MNNNLKTNPIKVLILSNFALLLFVLNIPGTIALRNVLAGLLLITLILSSLKSDVLMTSIFKNKTYSKIVLILLTLSTYIFFHSIFKADEVEWSLSQYRTQWIYPMLYFLIGTLLSFLASNNIYFNKKTLINILFFSLFLHVVYIDLMTIYKYLETGNLLTRYGGLTKSSVLANYITNILISIIIVEIIYRFRVKKRLIHLNTFLLITVLIFCIFASVIEGLRFGVVSLFFMSLTAVIFIVIDNPKFDFKAKSLISLAIVILCSLPLTQNIKSDTRWVTLIETIPIAMDTENNTFWRDENYNNVPKLTDGTDVNHSNYMRVAWAVKGIEFITNDIFGIGYGKNIFGHAIEKYEKNNTVRGWHSHSAIIDFTIGVGLIGLIIWLLFISKIIISSTSVFINSGNYFSLLTIFITSGFFIRSIIDSNMRDHMFKQFFLILGIALTLTFYEYKKKQKEL